MSRGEGYDFTPILTHYLFLLTGILSVVGWLTAFIGLAASQAQFNRVGQGSVGTQWFGIFLQLGVILGVFHTLASDSIAMNRFQLSVFGAVALVFSVQGANAGIFTGSGAFQAMGAGFLILSMVNILWVLYFTSEEDSLTLHIFNLLGTGGLTGPGRRRRAGVGRTPSAVNNGYTASGAYNQSPGPQTYGGGINMGMTESTSMGAAARSQTSLGMGVGGDVRSLSGAGGGSIGGGAPAMNLGSPDAPLMGGAVGNSGADGGEPYSYRAKALYAYQASPDDPNEISFSKGEILEIMDNSGKWWQAKKSDGTTGIAPSNYLQII